MMRTAAETEIESAQFDHCFEHQSRSGEQDQRHRHFEYDQCIAHRRARSRAAASALA